MKWQIAVALLAFAIAPSAFAQRTPPPPTSGIYSARPADAGAAAEKRIGSITWVCKAGLCRSKEAVSFHAGDAMTACKALFTWRGALTSYGRTGREFTAAELTECNTPPPLRAIPRPPGAPPLTQPSITTPPKTPG